MRSIYASHFREDWGVYIEYTSTIRRSLLKQNENEVEDVKTRSKPMKKGFNNDKDDGDIS